MRSNLTYSWERSKNAEKIKSHHVPPLTKLISDRLTDLTYEKRHPDINHTEYHTLHFQRIFEATEALRASAETFDRFFRAGAPINENTDSDGANPRK